jgi:hypothetical protein
MVPHDWPHAEVSVSAVVLAGPSIVASAGASAICRFALSEVPLSVSGWWRGWVTTTSGTKSIESVACWSDHLKLSFH